MIPRATYRLQFNSGFTFAQAEGIVPYLSDLGISHVYASPVTVAQPGSTHGYDVVDPTRINPELGGEAGFVGLVRALRAHDMGLIRFATRTSKAATWPICSSASITGSPTGGRRTRRSTGGASSPSPASPESGSRTRRCSRRRTRSISGSIARG